MCLRELLVIYERYTLSIRTLILFIFNQEDMEINKEILIYRSIPYTKYRWIGYMSAVQFGFLSMNLFFLPTSRLIRERREALENRIIRRQKEDDERNHDPNVIEDEFIPNPDYDPSSLLERFKKLNIQDLFTLENLKNNISENPYLSIGLLSASIAITTAFTTFARRTIHTITLLPYERVRLTFFTPFCHGQPPALESSLRNISCVAPRTSPHNYAILKLKGYRGYHLISKKEGEFLQPKLFDNHLGYSRSWA